MSNASASEPTVINPIEKALHWVQRAEKAYENRIEYGGDEQPVSAARIAQAWALIAGALP